MVVICIDLMLRLKWNDSRWNGFGNMDFSTRTSQNRVEERLSAPLLWYFRCADSVCVQWGVQPGCFPPESALTGLPESAVKRGGEWREELRFLGGGTFCLKGPGGTKTAAGCVLMQALSPCQNFRRVTMKGDSSNVCCSIEAEEGMKITEVKN